MSAGNDAPRPDRTITWHRSPSVCAWMTLGLLAAVPACGAPGDDAPGAKVTDSAGVRVVLNRGADVTLDWTFARALTIGGADDGPEAFYEVGRSAVDTDAEGRLYVLDRGNHRVVVFDRAGRHVRTMGREGGGPGELQWPWGITVSPDGIAAVADMGKNGLVRYDARGEPLEQQRLEGWRGGKVGYRAGDVLIEVREREGEEWHERLRVLRGAESTVLASIPSPTGRPVDLGCVQLSGMPPVFTPSLVWASGDERVAVVTGAAYVIDVYEGNRLALSVRRDLPPRPATMALARAELGDSFTVRFSSGGACVAPVEQVIEQRGFADVIPAVAEMIIAPDGTFWVRRRAVGEGIPSVDLFAPDGTYRGTLPAGAPFPAAFLPDGSVVTVERDELDVPRVVVYDVGRG